MERTHYAAHKKLSLSRLIENYYDSLTKEQDNDFEISQFVKSIATGKSIPMNTDWKKMRTKYSDHLDEKYGI